MKNYILLTFFLWSISNVQAQPLTEAELPASVLSAYGSMFGDTKVKAWEREQYGLYEAEFTWEGLPTSATFNANGLLQRTEQVLPSDKLPDAIVRHAKKLYPNHKIAECARIKTPDKRLMYEVELRKGKERRSLIFDENNNYLREEVDEDDDQENRKKG